MRTKRFLGVVLSAVMCLSLLPTFSLTASADTTTTTEKNITLGTSALKGGQASNVYFGTYQQSSLGDTEPTEGTENVDWIKSETAKNRSQGPYYKKEPIKWRVLSNADGKAFLLSDKNLDAVRYHEDSEGVTWETSTIRSWLNGYDAASNQNSVDYSNENFINAAFGAAEKGVIAETNVVNDDNPSKSTEGGENTKDKVFLLSIAEAQNTAYGFTNNYSSTDTRKAVNTAYVYGGGKNGASGMRKDGKANYWWLRSPGLNTEAAALVYMDGGVAFNGGIVSNNLNAVRPAFNLNLSSVLFTSAAKCGKIINAGTVSKNADLSTLTDSDGYKLTLSDSSRSFSVSETAVTSAVNKSVSLTYTGAKTGTNEYISAMIANASGEVLYYGQLAQASSESGTVSLTIPADIEFGTYTLKLFNEQVNGDYKTDFSSAFIDISLTVGHNYNNGICACGEYQLAELKDGVYQIGNAGQLIWFAKLVNGGEKAANAILTDNIDMTGIAWTPITSTGLYYSSNYKTGYGDADTGYAGTFDGNCHVIKNLSVTAIEGETWTYGLFGTMTGTVKNLGIDGFTYNHNNASDMRVGAIVGQNLGGTIENCYAVKANITPGTNVAGGITGSNYAGTIKNCYVADSSVVASSTRYGYIAGDNRADTEGDRLGTIDNCYTDGDLLTGSYTGNETNSKYGVNYKYFTNGGLVWYLNGQSADGIWKQGETHPDFTGTAVTRTYTQPTIENGVYQIASESELRWFADYVNFTDASVSAALTKNIEMKETDWTPIGMSGSPFTGTFDGAGYSITNFKMSATEGGHFGLFGEISNATVKNFSIDGEVTANFSAQQTLYYGVIAVSSNSTVTDVHSSVKLMVEDSFDKGGIAGIVANIASTTIERCSFNGTLDIGTAYVDCGGGIVGYAGHAQTHVIRDCAFYGKIIANHTSDDNASSGQIGGILGYYRGSSLAIENCLSVGTFEIENSTFTGMIGGRVLQMGTSGIQNVSNNYYCGSLPAFSDTEDETHGYWSADMADYSGYGDTNAASVTTGQLTSGEVAYLLGSQWGQTIDTDDYPLLGGDKVYKYIDGYSNEQEIGFAEISEDTKTAKLNIPVAGTYTVIFADYEGNTFVDSDIVVVTVSEDAVGEVSAESDITLGRGDKIMLWGKTSGMQSLCSAFEISE